VWKMAGKLLSGCEGVSEGAKRAVLGARTIVADDRSSQCRVIMK